MNKLIRTTNGLLLGIERVTKVAVNAAIVVLIVIIIGEIV